MQINWALRDKSGYAHHRAEGILQKGALAALRVWLVYECRLPLTGVLINYSRRWANRIGLLAIGCLFRMLLLRYYPILNDAI